MLAVFIVKENLQRQFVEKLFLLLQLWKKVFKEDMSGKKNFSKCHTNISKALIIFTGDS